MSTTSATVVLMSDTHRPLPLPRKTSALHFTSLAALVNAHYACVHGYDFLYLRLSDEGCVHPHFGTRHASYCKLSAIAHALLKWSNVIFIDSDSWFAPGAPTIEALISATSDAHGARDRAPLQPPPPPILSLAWDWPYSNGPNCGFMVWRNSSRALQLLATWWHIDSGVYAREHDFEQHAMHWVRLTRSPSPYSCVSSLVPLP